MPRIWRHEDGRWPNLAALTYCLAAYAGGLALITQGSLLLALPGILLLAHGLVIGAYLIHECAHNTILRDNRWNARLGETLSWLVGSAYGDYEGIRHKHFRHHVDRADIVAFDFRVHLQRHPALLRVIQALEWLYIPAVDLLMHALVLVLPFTLPSRRHRRARVIGVLLTRLAFFGLLAALSPMALIYYAIAYLLFLHVLRFMDVHQHTYPLFEHLEQAQGESTPAFDRAHEERNTYSNLVSVRHPWMNLLTLNFGYHNAHHTRPTEPWYRLPALHRRLYGDQTDRVLPVGRLLGAYHRHRVARVLHADPPDRPVGDPSGFVGVVGVSFLTAH
ncbi:fatty acid desaturase family protein [Thioalkalivibrio sulfidiphilus]|uniref:fatty acid desaturase family protein n=1 Tax=Thioalkalivibrio sulfidiphilus TaxID=1033854 RepID=UPI003B33D18B